MHPHTHSSKKAEETTQLRIMEAQATCYGRRRIGQFAEVRYQKTYPRAMESQNIKNMPAM